MTNGSTFHTTRTDGTFAPMVTAMGMLWAKKIWGLARCQATAAALTRYATGAFFSSGCLATGPLGLGPYALARTARPELFTRACFAELDDRYVVCGSAERAWADDDIADLRMEARLDAEGRLSEALHATTLNISMLQPAFEWSICSNSILVANFTIPRNAVGVVTRSHAHTTSPTPRKSPCLEE